MGTKKHSLPIANVGLLHADLAVFDLIYSPKETRLLQEAKKIGAKGYNGLGDAGSIKGRLRLNSGHKKKCQYKVSERKDRGKINDNNNEEICN